MNVFRSRLGRAVLAALVLGFAGTGSVACSDVDEPPAFALDLGSQLEADTGVRWEVGARAATGEVRSMVPERPVAFASADPEKAAAAFLSKYRRALGSAGDERELRAERLSDADADGVRYVRYSHVEPKTGLPVFDTSTVAAFTSTGEILYVAPGFVAGVDNLPTEPRISKAEALSVAQGTVSAHCGGGASGRLDEAVLGILGQGKPRLVYRIGSSVDSLECHSPKFTVDAESGALTSFDDGVRAFVDPRAKGVHYYRKNNGADVKPVQFSLSGGKAVLETSSLRNANEPWLPQIRTRAYRGPEVEADIEMDEHGDWDSKAAARGAAVDAHYHAARGMDFFREFLGRRALDNAGSDILVVVHDPSATENASRVLRPGLHYKRGGVEVVTFGDNTAGALPLTAFDVVVHELAHGITANTSSLSYARESGALNESFSDVMAASAELWMTEQAEKLPVATVPTLMGENTDPAGHGTRDLVDPSAHGQPDHYRDLVGCGLVNIPSSTNDYCGVHANSGIANRAWSLMALGGVHARSGVTVRGMGWHRAAKLWYTTIANAKSDYSMRVTAEHMIARAAFHGPDAVIAAGCAWHAVGLGDFRFSTFTTQMCARVAAAAPVMSKSTCSGVAFGYVCQDGSPTAAYACVNGSIASGVLCREKGKRCKKRSATDWAATFDVINGLDCE